MKLFNYLRDPIKRRDLWLVVIHFNLFKTIYFNFRMLPFKYAIKMPIVFFGKTSFLSLYGNVVLDSEQVSFGMIKFGFPLDMYYNPSSRGVLKLHGLLKFSGKAIICCGYSINIGQNGSLQVGNDIKIGAKVEFSGDNNIIIGNFTRIAFETIMMSSTFHYVLNLENNTIFTTDGDIVIGEYNWIGNRTVLYKGTKTPSNFIIASNSILNKNYIGVFEEYSMVGGIPLKLLKKNVTRIWNGTTEAQLRSIFRSSNIEIYQSEDIKYK